MRTEQEILRKKKEIEEAKQELAELRGSEKTLYQQMEQEFHCTTLEEAAKLLEKKKQELELLDNEIADLEEVIEQKYFSED